MKKIISDPEHLATLQDYYARHRVLPSYNRLMPLLGFASRSGIKKVLERLQTAGLLARTKDGDWAPTDKFFERSIAHQPVVAGMPLATADEGGDLLALRYRLGFFLPVPPSENRNHVARVASAAARFPT